MKDGLRAKATRLILSGGEATIHPHFIEFIKIAKKLGYQEIQVITNGRMFAYKEFLDKAVKAGLSEITFSIHSHRKSLYENFSGIKDSYSQVIAGLKNATTYPNLIINIDIVINKLNYRDIYSTIIYFAKKFGIYEYDLLQVMPNGRAWQNQSSLFYDIKRALPYLKKVFELAKNDKRYHIWTNRFPVQYLEGYEFLIQDKAKLKDDVLGASNMFKNYLCQGELMSCYQPKRCHVCNLNNFCQKLIEFNNLDKSSVLKKISQIIKSPLCYQIKSRKSAVDFLSSKHLNLIKFLDFYLANLCKVKSTRCTKCKQDKICAGADVNLIKKLGFNILKPII
jgi:MoaA/NifB/PqqE/SkfB family radical SAM enzyme